MTGDPRFKILVIDDEYCQEGPDRKNFLQRVGRDESEFVFTSGQTGEGRNVAQVTLDVAGEMWERALPCRLSLILLDVRFRDDQDAGSGSRFGFTLLRALRERFGRALPVVMLTNEADVRGSANEAGADGFLPKENLSPEALERQLFRNGLFPARAHNVLGTAPAFLLMLRELRRTVSTGIMEILLLGETGTGKSECAEYFSQVTNRRRDRFQRWFARSTNPELHYCTLFGYWKGAFTDANAHRAGLAERAHEGTLFIDEIAEMEPSVQPDLLEYRQRSSQDGLRRVRRLGQYPGARQSGLDLVGVYSTDEDRILVDTALITATNKPIDDPEWRERTGFRLDLFNRLGHRITLPPLRERAEDIVPLFLALFRREAGREIALTPEAQKMLQAHEWREGNVEEARQLAASVKTRIGPEFDEIQPHHLEDLLAQKRASAGMGASAPMPSAGAAAAKTAAFAEAAREGASAAGLVDHEVLAHWGVAERLRTAVIETRRPGQPGTLTDILKHATGVTYAATDVKREVKDLLAPWFAPNERKAARWNGNPHYRRFVDAVRADAVLSSLYQYSAGEIDWNQARMQMAPALEPNPRES